MICRLHAVFILAVCAPSLAYAEHNAPVTFPQLPHVANNAALAALPASIGRVRREGVTASSDGGAADYSTTSSACSIVGGDGGSQVALTSGGCANIDWASINDVASIGLFENVSTATDDTVAIKAAVATKRRVRFPCVQRPWIASSDIPVPNGYQLIEGCARDNGYGTSGTQIKISSPAGFAKGVFYVTFNNLLPGAPTFRNITGLFVQPDVANSKLSTFTVFVPLFYAQNVPGVTFEHIGCLAAYDCFDLRGNDGTAFLDDIQMSPMHYGIQIDGSIDWVWLRHVESWPFGLTTNQINYFYNGGSDGSGPTGLLAGRVDGLHGSDILLSMFQGMNLYSGTYAANTGTPSGAMDGVGIDTGTGITMSAGDFQFANLSIYTAVKTSAYVQTGGRVAISSLKVFQGNGTAPLSSTAALMSVQGGSLTIAGADANMGSFDQPVLAQSGGIVNWTGSSFYKAPGIGYANGVINVAGAILATTTTAASTNTQITISATSAVVVPGALVSGTGIPAGTIVAPGGVNGTTITLSNTVNVASGASVTFTTSTPINFTGNSINPNTGGSVTFVNVNNDQVGNLVANNSGSGAQYVLAGTAMPNIVPETTQGSYTNNGSAPVPQVPQISVSTNTNFSNLYPQQANVNATSGLVVMGLPGCTAGLAGRTYKASKQDSSTNSVLISTGGSDKINGTTAISTTTQYGTLSATCSATLGVWTAGY